MFNQSLQLVRTQLLVIFPYQELSVLPKILGQWNQLNIEVCDLEIYPIAQSVCGGQTD
ncbi:MAG TPA: hypothetical protein IGS40_13840 [Trichormus sp. M33_DOE_039]|nr:hypothetical protein [Trichormus sp. M33_DOE_039]